MKDTVIDGATILVTGASSGIGMAIARRVASRAKAVVLVARRAAKLEELKRELVAARPDLRVEIVACDLASREEIAKLVAEMRARELAIDVLVNNAGVGMVGLFERADAAKTSFMIDLNVTSLTLLTLAFLPDMVARGRGGILNVSSGFGLATMPLFAAYCGTKHYVTAFTEGLRADLTGTGVIATMVCPGPVATEFDAVMGYPGDLKTPAFFKITADECARASLEGLERGRAIVVPGLLMKFAMLINGLSPRVMRRLFNALLGRYARARLPAQE